ncbi:hypothetical protein BaRGS_00008908 [Batillaria attramentaria]|uniref:Uncharacterized protein n=1 Tax=Batillaria attramentaria TaxID=370345 RepID=A0ABD0LJV3_9CAEN
MQTDYIIPVIFEAWKEMQGKHLQDIRERGVPLRIAGDGRCDSPGFSAKYCTYTLIDLTTNAVIAFAVVCVTDAGSSPKMEVKGFQS